MIVTHEMKMDLARRNEVPRIDVAQDDRYSRELRILLYNQGRLWKPEPGTEVMVHYVKPDGTGGSYDVLPDGTPAWRMEGGCLVAALTPQVCTVPGAVQMSVSLMKGDAQVSTFQIELEVHANPSLTAVSRDYYNKSRTLRDHGWESDMLLGTDGQGKVVTVKPTEPGVRSVNGMAPDEMGNVDLPVIDTGMPLPAAAQVGQYLRVLEVDENGMVTAVEAANLETETKKAKTYLYNGVELPALPTVGWDKKKYPYVILTGNERFSLFYALQSGPNLEIKGQSPYEAIYVPIGETYLSTYTSTNTTGGIYPVPVEKTMDNNLGQDGRLVFGSDIVWANYIVKNRLEEPAVRPTEPVPVWEEDGNPEEGGTDLLAQAKAYTDSQRLGYVELNTVPTELSQDTDPNAYTNRHLGENRYVLMAPNTKDINYETVRAVTVVQCDTSSGEPVYTHTRYERGEMVGSEAEGVMTTAISVPDRDDPILYIVRAGNVGLYVFYDGGAMTWVESIEVETVHKIDQKFIPGTISVIDLKDSGETLIYSSEGSVTLSAAESILLNEAMGNMMPCVVRLWMLGVPWYAVSCNFIGGFIPMFVGEYLDTSNRYLLYFGYVDGNWLGGCMNMGSVMTAAASE